MSIGRHPDGVSTRTELQQAILKLQQSQLFELRVGERRVFITKGAAIRLLKADPKLNRLGDLLLLVQGSDICLRQMTENEREEVERLARVPN